MQGVFDEEISQDLRANGFEIDEKFGFNVSLASLSIEDEKTSKQFGKEIGKYRILNSPQFFLEDENVFDYTKKQFIKILKQFSMKKKKVLVVGLGNFKIPADSFGCLCVDKLPHKKNLFAIKPDVYQNTNIFACDIIEGVASVVNPELVIVIDSLGTYNIKRLGCSFQVSNVGIVPGGAIYKGNKPISKKTLKIPCVVIGVPLMVFSKGLNPNLDEFYGNIILTDKDIDILVSKCADLVAQCISKVF